MSRRLSLASFLGRAFWLPALAAMAAGLWCPGDFHALAPLVPLSLGGILYFTALKVELADVARQLATRRALFGLSSASFIKLFAVPLACFGVARLVAPEWAIGVLIVMAMPAGMASAAMADLYGADVPFVLALTLVTSVLCPVTVPLLTLWFDPTAHVDPRALGSRAVYIVLLLTIPFALAQTTRRLLPRFVATHYERWGYGSIASTCILIFMAIGANRSAWATFATATLVTPLWLTSALIAGLATAGALARRSAAQSLAPDRSVSVARKIDGLTYGSLWMNNGLAIAFCNRFFHGHATAMLPAVLIQLPIVASVAVYGTYALRARARALTAP